MKVWFASARRARVAFVSVLLVMLGVHCCTVRLVAQPYLEVRPVSFGDAASLQRLNVNVDVTGLLPAARIDTRFMPLMNNDSLMRAEGNKATGPFQFGHSLKVRLGTDNAGTWETLPNGDRIWRLRVVSPGAYSLNFLYDKFVVPEGALFFIYNDLRVEKNKDNLIGAFSSEHSSSGVYATDLLKGSSAVLEYYEPRAVRGKGAISLSNVIHGYRDAFAYLKTLLSSSKKNDDAEMASLSCQVDVNSPAGANYQTVKRGVAVVLTNLGTSLCSGSLINNTGTSYRPYFLTALHCTRKRSGVLDGSDIQYLQSWLFKFNYESGGLQPITYGNGCTFRASNAGSDMLLVELNQKVSSSLFFNGWSNAGATTPATPVAAIHHPGGDLKKIATSNNPIFSATASSSQFDYQSQVWGVTWDFSNGLNTGGLLEAASSGAPLLNQQLRIVGQDFGSDGQSFTVCGQPQTEYFGRFDISWPFVQSWLNPGGGITDYNGAPPMNVTITGLSKLAPGSTAVLTANVSGGVPPYQYDWYVIYPPSTIEYYLASGQSLTIYGNTDEQQFIARIRDAATPQGKIDQAFKTVVNGFGTFALRPPVEIQIPIAASPNPFSENSLVSYTLPDDATVSVEICNALQQPVLTLANNARQQAGYHEFTVQKHLPNGAYFVRLTAQDRTGKMLRTSFSIMVAK
jgi:hypothetical protein